MLYQLSYASGLTARGKRHNSQRELGLSSRRRRPVVGPAAPRRSGFGPHAKRQPGEVRYWTLPSGCLFPRERGVTGMNPTVLTASLTGRILFFFDELRTTTHRLILTDVWCSHPSLADTAVWVRAPGSLEAILFEPLSALEPPRAIGAATEVRLPLDRPGTCPFPLGLLLGDNLWG